MLREETDADPSVDEALDDGDERTVRCGSCDHTITHLRARKEVNGAHRHVQVNPSGIPYDIACYANAPGLIGRGPFEGFWTWFPGYDWQIGICTSCGRHLGWHFRGEDGGFVALIAARIVE